MRKITLLLIFLLFLGNVLSQKLKPTIGMEVNTNFWKLPFTQAMLRGEFVHVKRTCSFGASIGGFVPNTNPDSGKWKGRLFTFGINAAGYLRGGKKYQPGIQLFAQTMFAPTNAGTSVFSEFYSMGSIANSSFKGIPFSFSPRLVQLFWSDRLGIEVGLGYRYFLVHYQSPILANYYRSQSSIEFSVGAKFLIKTKKN